MPLRSRREVFVPITVKDGRSRRDKLGDMNYIKNVAGLANNDIFKSEVLHALKRVRDAADTAKTPEELSGMQVGIRAIKDLLIAPEKCRTAIVKFEETGEKEDLRGYEFG